MLKLRKFNTKYLWLNNVKNLLKSVKKFGSYTDFIILL
jgi:hypothetical protein